MMRLIAIAAVDICSASLQTQKPATPDLDSVFEQLESWRTKYSCRKSRGGSSIKQPAGYQRGPPPIVYSGGYDLKSVLRAWIDAESGVLWRAEVRMRRFNNPDTSRVRVEFALDKGRGVIVPPPR